MTTARGQAAGLPRRGARASARPTPCSARVSRRCERGTDVVVGFVETHGRRHTAEMLEGLEIVPRQSGAYRGADVHRDGRRRRAGPPARRSRWSTSSRTPTCPAVAEREALAGHRGAARRRHRRHLHGQHPAPRVAQRRGREDHRRAAARDRARRGRPRAPTRSSWSTWRPRRCAAGWPTATSTPPRRSTPRSATTSGSGNLTALRELALLWTADRVDEALQGYRAAARHRGHLGDPRTGRRRAHRRPRGRDADPPRGPDRRPVVRRRPARRARHPVRRAHRRRPAPARRAATAGRDLGGTYHQVIGDDVADALLEFARAENATQLVLGGSRRSRLAGAAHRPGHRRDHHPRLRRHRRAPRHPRARSARAGLPALPGRLTRRRRVQGFALAVVLPPLLTLALLAEPATTSTCQRRAAVPAGRRRRRPGRRPLAGASWPPSAARCC